MTIDADCHISPTDEGGVSIGADELVRRMDQAGVDRAVAWLQPPYERHTREANAYVYDATQTYPDRVLGFGWADPNLGVEAACQTVRRCVEDYGFQGVKLNGAQNSFYIDAPDMSMPVIEEIAATGKLLALHVGADAPDRTHPFRVAKIARAFPDLQMLAVHMGGVGHADLTGAMIEFAAQCPNITLVGSAVRTRPILSAIRELGPRRVCFGSDTPFGLMHVEVARYGAMLGPELDAAERALVMGGNIERLFGLG
jgi:hypothetical protein